MGSPVFWGLLLALVSRLCLAHLEVKSDSRRFMDEARQMLAGDGFGRNGQLESHLPPGYPVFISSVFLFSDSISLLYYCQIAISVVSCYLVYAAIRPHSRKGGLAALYLMALSPTLSFQSGVILSETLGAFLMSALVWVLMRVEMRATAGAATLAGLLATALLMTSPGVLVLYWLLLGALVWQIRSNHGSLVALAVGVLLLMVPWQMHQLRAVGRVVPAVYEFHKQESQKWQGLANWIRTWQITENELGAYHCYRSAGGLERFDENIPERAFSSAEQRACLRRVCERYIRGELSSETFDREFWKIAVEARRQRPLACYVGLPVLRAVAVWFYVDKVWPAQLTYFGRLTPAAFRSDLTDAGLTRALARAGKGIFSTLLVLMNGGYAILFLLAGWQALRTRRPVAIAIVLGVLGYTAVGALIASHEWRRNLVFYPALLFLLFYWPAGHGSAAAPKATGSNSSA